MKRTLCGLGFLASFALFVWFATGINVSADRFGSGVSSVLALFFLGGLANK